MYRRHVLPLIQKKFKAHEEINKETVWLLRHADSLWFGSFPLQNGKIIPGGRWQPRVITGMNLRLAPIWSSAKVGSKINSYLTFWSVPLEGRPATLRQPDLEAQLQWSLASHTVSKVWIWRRSAGRWGASGRVMSRRRGVPMEREGHVG